MRAARMLRAAGLAAGAGVGVNVLLDAVGAAKMDRTLVDRMQQAGANVAWFRPVRDLLGGFLDNWAEATAIILTGGNHLPSLERLDDGVPIQVTRTTAEKGSTDDGHLFYSALRSARERLWITTACFAPRTAFVFLRDLEHAEERTLDGWRSRPPGARAREYASAAIRREL